MLPLLLVSLSEAQLDRCLAHHEVQMLIPSLLLPKVNIHRDHHLRLLRVLDGLLLRRLPVRLVQVVGLLLLTDKRSLLELLRLRGICQVDGFGAQMGREHWLVSVCYGLL